MTEYHHGYLFTGNIESSLAKVSKMSCQILGVDEKTLSSHPDFYSVKSNPFTINDAKDIRRRASNKSFGGKGRIFLICANSFTREAGNALLKTFEEPIGETYFFVVTYLSDNILDTLRSRLVVIETKEKIKASKEKIEFVKKFLSSEPSKRVSMIQIFEDDKEKILDFFGNLEIVLRERLQNNFSSLEIISALDQIDRQRYQLLARGVKPKMFTDYSCLVLPQI